MVQKKAHMYVNIPEPIVLRRNILESSRTLIHILQDLEKIRILRDQKHELFQEFDTVVKEINSLSLKINSDLPTISTSDKKKSKKKRHKKVTKSKTTETEVKEPPISRKKSELEILEDELTVIEKELSKLN
ncbi:MAG: hypothetical protein ACMXX8_02000 [Candidatus Woesearchaeota archaeon]